MTIARMYVGIAADLNYAQGTGSIGPARSAVGIRRGISSDRRCAGRPESGDEPMPLSEYEYITVKYVDGVAIVSFSGSMAMFEGDKVQAVGKELADLVDARKEPRILLNLSNAHFMSSAMLAHLVKIHRKIQTAKGRLRLCGLRPVILDAFKVSQFDKIFEIFPDETAALKKF
jgi:anti-sigma B factor antagonist